MNTNKWFVFLFVFAGILRAENAVADTTKFFAFMRIPDKVEWVQSFSVHNNEHYAHGKKLSTGVNYVDISHQFGKIALDGYVLGFHHGTVGAASATVPFRIKNLTLAPGILTVFGPYETGPGFGVRWQYCYKAFCTEGTLGAFHPVGGVKKLQFIMDPFDLDLHLFIWADSPWLTEVKVGYSGEFGVYGPFGTIVDRVHGVQGKLGPKHPVSKWISNHVTRRESEALASYVPDGKIFRVGFSFNPRAAHKH